MIVNIIQLLKLPDGTVKVLVEGQQRTKLIDLQDNGEFFLASHELIETQWSDERIKCSIEENYFIRI